MSLVTNYEEAVETYCRTIRPGLSPRPSYYSGRGVTLSDLTPAHLTAIYRGLVKDFGPESGEAFCRMVQSLKRLSATNFLSQLEYFFRQGKRWASAPVAESDFNLDVDGPETAVLGVAFATVAGALSNLSSGAVEQAALTEQIKKSFFREIGYTPTTESPNRVPSEPTAIKDLSPGEGGCITPWSVDVSEDGSLTVSAGLTVNPLGGGTITTSLVKTSATTCIIQHKGKEPQEARIVPENPTAKRHRSRRHLPGRWG